MGFYAEKQVIREKPTAGKNDAPPRTTEVEKSPGIIGLRVKHIVN